MEPIRRGDLIELARQITADFQEHQARGERLKARLKTLPGETPPEHLA